LWLASLGRLQQQDVFLARATGAGIEPLVEVVPPDLPLQLVGLARQEPGNVQHIVVHVLVVLEQMYRYHIDFNFVEGQRLQDLYEGKVNRLAKVFKES